MKKFEEMHLLARYLGYIGVASLVSVVIFVRPGELMDESIRELKNNLNFVHVASVLTMAMSLVDMVRCRFVENIKTDSENEDSLLSVQIGYLFFAGLVYLFTYFIFIFLLNKIS